MILVNLAVSSCSWISNSIAAFKAMTSEVHNLISVLFWLSLVLMIANEVLGVIAYMLIFFNNSYLDFYNQARLQAFLIFNLVDLIFWFYGLQSLDFEKGDKVRDEIVKFWKDNIFAKSRKNQEELKEISQNH